MLNHNNHEAKSGHLQGHCTFSTEPSVQNAVITQYFSGNQQQKMLPHRDKQIAVHHVVTVELADTRQNKMYIQSLNRSLMGNAKGLLHHCQG